MKQNQKGRPDELARDSRDTVIADPLTARKNMEEVLACATSLIRCRLAVMSGKGGVGKSTVAVNLASALAISGHDVGVLDADVHGPDVPMMFGLQGQLPESTAGYLLPLVAQRKHQSHVHGVPSQQVETHLSPGEVP